LLTGRAEPHDNLFRVPRDKGELYMAIRSLERPEDKFTAHIGMFE